MFMWPVPELTKTLHEGGCEMPQQVYQKNPNCENWHGKYWPKLASHIVCPALHCQLGLFGVFASSYLTIAIEVMPHDICMNVGLEHVRSYRDDSHAGDPCKYRNGQQTRFG